MPTPIEIGTRVRTLRENLGLSQRKVARDSMISQAGLSRIENGDRVATGAELFHLGQALGTSLSELASESPLRERVGVGMRLKHDIPQDDATLQQIAAVRERLISLMEADAVLREQGIGIHRV
ncbi:helix-turn-helix domain-containing protein [Pseudolysinimonas sp.]